VSRLNSKESILHSLRLMTKLPMILVMQDENLIGVIKILLT